MIGTFRLPMNEQQIEAVEELAKVFPRGVLVLTFMPNDKLEGRLEHTGETIGRQKSKVALSDDADVHAYGAIRNMILDFWENGFDEDEDYTTEGVF